MKKSPPSWIWPIAAALVTTASLAACNQKPGNESAATQDNGSSTSTVDPSRTGNGAGATAGQGGGNMGIDQGNSRSGAQQPGTAASPSAMQQQPQQPQFGGVIAPGSGSNSGSGSSSGSSGQ